MNFVYPVTLVVGSSGPQIVNAQWFKNLSVVPDYQPNTLIVAEYDCGDYPAGLYYRTGLCWQLVMPYVALCVSLVNSGQLTVYANPPSQITAPTGASVYHNGYAYGSTIPAGNGVWLVKTIPNSGSGSGSGSGSTSSPYTPPQLSSFTWVNQGSAAATQQDWGISFKQPAFNVGNSLACLVQNTPSAPYSATVHMNPLMASLNFELGFAFRNSASGKIQTFEFNGPGGSTSGSITITVVNYASPTDGSPTSGVVPYVGVTNYPAWIRARDNGTNRYMDGSQDGVSWVTFFSVPRTSFITPDQIGVFANNSFASYPTTVQTDMMMKWSSWTLG